MRREALIVALALAFGGCAGPAGERVRELNEDGVHLYERGSYAHARETFQVALDLGPGDPDILYNLGRCHDQLGQPERAERLYRQCLQAGPAHADCRHALVVLLVVTGRRPEAGELVQDWLRREPNAASGYVEDAWLLSQDGDLPAARARLQQAVSLEPRNSHALVELGRLYGRMNYPDRALVMYERALESDPHQPEIARLVSGLRSHGVVGPHPE